MNVKTAGSLTAIVLCATSSVAIFAAPTAGSKVTAKNTQTSATIQSQKTQITRLEKQIAVQQREIARLRKTVSLLQQALADTQRTPAQNVKLPEPTVTQNPVPPVLSFTMKNLSGQAVDLKKYQGQVVLIVNTASQCGYTPQYKGLQELHKLYAKQGLAILGFPSNDFGGQEPGSEAEIQAFCQKNYGVEFDMFSKVGVKGAEKVGLYKYLTSEETNPQSAGEVQWNFEKFLIGRDGRIVSRFRSNIAPTSQELVKAVEAELAKK